MLPGARAQTPASPDQARFEFEREKWRDELNLRTRELALKEAELQAKRAAPPASPWYTNPLVLAILAATVAAIGNAVVATVNGRMQRRLENTKRDAELTLEATKAESTRILEMIKTGDTEAAAKNLQFLVDTGLVASPERAEKLRNYLADRAPGSGPALPATSPRFGFEKTESLPTSLQESIRRNLEGFVSYLDQAGFPKDAKRANVKIYKMDQPNAFYRDGTLEIDVGYAEDPYTALREFGHHALTAPMGDKPWARGSHVMPIESGLADYFAGSFLNNPRVGEVIARLEGLDVPYLRTLDNERRYSEFAALEQEMQYHSGGEIWGGAFWEMRSRLGREKLDPILARAWLVEAASEQEPTAKSFVAALLTAAEDKISADAIRSVLRHRGFPVPRATRQA
jgi:hypothetical protein